MKRIHDISPPPPPRGNKGMGSSSSTVVRRCLSNSNSGILKSGRCGYRTYFRSNHGESQPVSGPLLMLPAGVDGKGNVTHTLHCPARNEYSIERSKMDEVVLAGRTKCVGSSHGWLAFCDWSEKDHPISLSNPTTARSITLPSIPFTLQGTADRLILSGNSAFMVYGSPGKLAFCRRPWSGDGSWTVLGELDDQYDNIMYSAKHNRLFCVRHRNYSQDVSVEAWDFHGEDDDDEDAPSLRFVVEDEKLNFGSSGFPLMNDLKRKCTRLTYLVTLEHEHSHSHSDSLFLVVRHVNPRVGRYGPLSMVEEEDAFLWCPYKTVDFDVYKIDLATMKVMHMEHHLQGLAMFVGINHPFAIPAKAAGLKPDAIYFTDENRLLKQTRLAEKINYGGHDNGIFDHVNRDFSACCAFYPIEYHKIRKLLPPPLWLTPIPKSSPYHL